MQLTSIQTKYIQHLKEKGVEVSLSEILEAKSFNDILDKVADRIYYYWLIRTNYGSMPIVDGQYDNSYFTIDNYIKYVDSFGDAEISNQLRDIVSTNSDISYVDSNFKVDCDKYPEEQPMAFHRWSGMFRLANLALD
jgi:sensor histidine kinase YesM